jgi:hypothetical protein
LNDLNSVKINEFVNNYSNTCFISTKTRELQSKMKVLFEKQKLVGGIIDIDENKQDVIILTVYIYLPPCFEYDIIFFIFTYRDPAILIIFPILQLQILIYWYDQTQ